MRTGLRFSRDFVKHLFGVHTPVVQFSSVQFSSVQFCALTPLSVAPAPYADLQISNKLNSIHNNFIQLFFLCLFVRLSSVPLWGEMNHLIFDLPSVARLRPNCNTPALLCCCLQLLVIDSLSVSLSLCYTLPAAYQLRDSLSYSSLSCRQTVTWFFPLEYRFQTSAIKNSINPIEGVSCPRRQWRPPVRAR